MTMAGSNEEVKVYHLGNERITMTEANTVLNYQMTPQTREALEQAAAVVGDHKEACLTSQLLLLSLLSARDSGAGFALGRYAITKSKISKEIAAASHVRARESFVLEESSDLSYSVTSERKYQEKRRHWLSEHPVQLLSEPPSDRVLQGIACPISQVVFDILTFADELRFQEDPTEGMDTYYILLGIIHHPESNAAVILEKLMAETLSLSYEDSLKAIFTMKEDRQYRKARDGHSTMSSRERYSRKQVPEQPILELIAFDITAQAEQGLIQPAVERDQELKQIEVAYDTVDTVSKAGKAAAAKVGDVVSSAGKGFSKMASAVGGWFG